MYVYMHAHVCVCAIIERRSPHAMPYHFVHRFTRTHAHTRTPAPTDPAALKNDVRQAVETYLSPAYLRSDGGFLASHMNPQYCIPLPVIMQVGG